MVHAFPYRRSLEMKKFSLLFALLCFYNCERTEEEVSVFWEDEFYPKVFFSYPGRFVPIGKKRIVRDEILRIIRETKESIYMHIYSFSDPEIESELIQANQRGVRLELMGEWGKSYPISILPFLKYWKGTGLQHTKVLVSDQSLVFIGTGNFTYYGLEQDHNGYLEFKLNRKEWENFYSFLKEDYPFPVLKIAGLEFWNSPQEGSLIQTRLFDSILSSRHSIRYLIFDHYDPILSSAFTRTNHGSISGIYDRPVDPEGKILSGIPGIEIMEDGNEDILDDPTIGKGGLLHHKTMILDDLEVLTGSYNYSLSARDSNREILIAMKDTRIAKEFKQEWENIRNKSKRVETAAAELATDSNYTFDPVTGQICRSETQPADLFLEIGFLWFRWNNLYRWKDESCKSITDYISISSRHFGGKNEFPKDGTENLGIQSFFINGKTGFSLPKSDLMEEFHSSILKPSRFLRPDYFLGSAGVWIFPTESELFELISGKLPQHVWILERGKLPRKLGVLLEDGVYYLSESVSSNSGVVLIEYEDLGLYFCYKAINYNLSWPEQILFSVYNYREGLGLSYQYSKSDSAFFSEQGLPNQRRKNLCVISL